MPAVVVGDERDRRVADLRLARELGFLQVGHADDVHAPRAVQLRLGQRRELRPFHADVGAAAVHGRADLLRRVARRSSPASPQNGCAKPTCATRPLPKNVLIRPLRAIEELIGDDDVERLVFLLQAADGARREDALDAEHLEAEDVGAEVQLGRQQPVAGAVPRQKRHALAAQRADDVRARRIAERRRDRPLFAIGQLRHVVQAAAADDADLIVRSCESDVDVRCDVRVAGLPGSRAVRRQPLAVLAGCSRPRSPDRARRRSAYSRSIASRDERALERQRVHRVQVVAHDPRHRRTCAVVGIRSATKTAVLPARLDHRRSGGAARVAAGAPHPHAGHDRRVVVDEVQHAGVGERHVSCRRGSWRGCARADASHPPTRRGGRRSARAGSAARTAPDRVARGEAAGVIEVQVRGEHDVDVVRRDARRRRARASSVRARSTP